MRWIGLVGMLLAVVLAAWVALDVPGPGGPEFFSDGLSEAAGEAPHNPFTFVAYGDTRTGHADHRAVVNLIQGLSPELVLHTGDMVTSGDREDEWKKFDEITRGLRERTAFYPCPGNHDMGGSGYADRFAGLSGSRARLYYSFDAGPFRFISLNSIDEESLKPGGAQYQWLESQLGGAGGRAIIVFMHYPLFSPGPHGASLGLREALHPLFRRSQVRVVFAGHDHLYYRTVREGILYVVTGGGGAPLYPIVSPSDALPGDVSESVHHAVLIKVDRGAMQLTALREDHTVIDALTLPAK